MVSTLAGLTPYFSRPHCPYLTPTTRVWGAIQQISASSSRSGLALYSLHMADPECVEAALPKLNIIFWSNNRSGFWTQRDPSLALGFRVTPQLCSTLSMRLLLLQVTDGCNAAQPGRSAGTAGAGRTVLRLNFLWRRFLDV